MILTYPDIDPVALSLGFFDIRWYGLSYAIGCLFVLLGASKLSTWQKSPIESQHFYDVFTLSVLGIVIGGRLGFVLFYAPAYYLAHPLEIFAIWKGGMSFHGATIGLLLAGLFYAWRHKISFLALSDTIVVFLPIGIGLGRIANFINGELWGRPTNANFGMIFPHVDNIPRHPSQLYEAFLEGFILFLILLLLTICTRSRFYIGLQTGVFFASYGVFRFIIEYFRTPDWQFTLLSGFTLTAGQLLSIPMIIGGLLLVFRACKQREEISS